MNQFVWDLPSGLSFGFGLNPELSAFAPLYEDGNLAIIHQAGCEDDSRSHFEA